MITGPRNHTRLYIHLGWRRRRDGYMRGGGVRAASLCNLLCCALVMSSCCVWSDTVLGIVYVRVCVSNDTFSVPQKLTVMDSDL